MSRFFEILAGAGGFLVSIALTIWLVLYVLRFIFGPAY